jgi:hypothetical protein
MTASDPLGRRSLFWAGSTEEERLVRGIESRPLGKHAFYSQEENVRQKAGSFRQIPVGPVVVVCASCAVRSEVSVPQFLALHLPFWLWRPGRGYARLMTCPACRKRTWLSATWRPLSRRSD